MSEDDDILKRLRSVRKRLQESLDDTGKTVERKEDSKIELVDSQRDIERRERRKTLESTQAASTGPKLYATAADSKPKMSNKEFKKAQGGVSRKRIAAMQRRVKKKVEAQRGVTNKQKALMVMAIVLASGPLFMINTVSLASCRFDFDNVGLQYKGRPGEVMITLPVYNPTFVPAKLGHLSLELWGQHLVNEQVEYYFVGKIHTSYEKVIDPYTTVVIDINLKLDSVTAGVWLADLFNSMTLQLLIRNFKYNGVTVAQDIPLPAFDLSGMVQDMTSGLNMDELAGGAMMDVSEDDNVKNLWSMATSPQKASNNLDGYPIAGQDDGDDEPPSFELLDLGLGEDDKTFKLKLDSAFYTGPLDGFYLGPIRIMELNATLYGPGGAGASEDNSTHAHYKNPIASLTTLVPGVDNITDFSWLGVPRDTSYPLEINLGGVSYAGARLTIYKDNLQGATEHPSASLNFSDEAAVKAFENENKTKYPTWFFVQNLMSNGMIDFAIRIEKLSIEIFGIPIQNIQISEDLLPIMKTSEPLFDDVSDLLGGAKVYPTGFLGGMQEFTRSVSTLGMYKNPVPAQPSLNLDDLGDILGDIEIGDTIQESWGENANISMGIGITIDNTMLDIFLGMENLTLGISNEVENAAGVLERRAFAIAKATNEHGEPKINIKGINSKTIIYLNITLMKNDEYKPHVKKFLLDLLEDFALLGEAALHLGKLVLFKENYTFEGISVSLSLDDLGIDLGGTLQDAVKDGLEGAVGGLEDGLSFQSPLTAPMELMSLMMLGNPLVSPITGIQFPGMELRSPDGKQLGLDPVAAGDEEEEIKLVVQEFGDKVVLDIVVPGIKLGSPEEPVLPITIGLGYSYLELQVNSSNTFGEWEPVLGLGINQYFEIGPRIFELDINAQLTVFKSDTLCAMLDAITDGRTTPSFSLRIAGSLTLNLSGIYMPEIQLALEVPDISISIPLNDMVQTLLGDSEAVEPGTNVIGPQKALVSDEAPLQWWDGNYDNILSPKSAQSFNMDDAFEIGDFLITGLEETNWPDKDQGTVTIGFEIELTNHLMTLGIIDPKFELYDAYDNLIAEILFLGGDVMLYQHEVTPVSIQMVLHKSQATEDWINHVLWTLEIPGKMDVAISIQIFGCTIGPLTIQQNTQEFLGMLGLDMASMLESAIPFNQYTLSDSPKASQDMMDLFGNFGIAYLSTRRNGTASPIQPVGSLNYDDPMFTVMAGLVLNPAFNMSIVDTDLYLCDGGIYDGIFSVEEDKMEAVKYSKIAQINMNPFPVYCNTTYDPNSDFSKVDGVDETNYQYINDPNKPYYNWSMNNTGVWGLDYRQIYNESNGEELLHGYGLGTFAMTEMELNLYNISHGSYNDRYPKKYWRAMGGPYFPVQVYDKYHGGYPDHRYVYHPNYAPLAALMSNVGDMMADPMALMGKVAFGGNLTLNVFSMDITLDASSPAVSGLISSLTTETFNIFMDEYRKAVNPWSDRQDPAWARLDDTIRVNQFYDDPTIPRFANSPHAAEFYTDLEMDMEAFIDDYPYIGMETRNDHIFAPGAHGPIENNGHAYMQDYRYMGTNINPYYFDEYGYVQVKPDYVPGVKDAEHPDATNEEVFVKDMFYEDFKLITQNWADGTNRLNPIFESENLTTYVAPNKYNGWVEEKEIIEDPQQWALRWSQFDAEGGRTATIGMIHQQAVVPAFELGILSAYGAAWNEDPAPGTECSRLTPIGYIWINSTTFPQIKNGRADDFWKGEAHVKAEEENGMTEANSSWLMLNLRLFDSLGTQDFIAGMTDIFNFNLHFYVDLTLNISIFGYEIYGVGMSKLNLGGHNTYENRCENDMNGGDGGSVWGVPGADGTIQPPQQYTSEDWLPKVFLPRYSDDTYSMDMGDMLGPLTDTSFLLDAILNGLKVDLGGITLTVALPLVSPLTLPGFIENLEGTLVINYDDAELEDVNPAHWEKLLDLGALGDIWRELNLYYHEGVPGGFNTNPYNIDSNMMGIWPAGSEYEGQPEQAFGEKIVLPTLVIHIPWGPILKILGGILGGQDHIWLTLILNSGEMYKMTDPYPWTEPEGGRINIILPPALGYRSYIPIAQEDVCFDVGGLL